MKLPGDAIAKAISKYNDEKKEDILANGSKSSGRSNKTVSRISSSSSATRMKPIAKVAAAEQQAEYDLLIAEKEIARRQFKADEELRKTEAKARYDHEIAVLKAKKLTAMIRDAHISPEQEINYLHKYMNGAPQNLVDKFRKRQHNNPHKLLKEVWVELERRFGNSAAISHALLGRLRDAAKFEDKDKKKLQELPICVLT